jgi:hypothetical protein
MANIRLTELPLAPHAVLADEIMACRKPDPIYGFLVDVRSYPYADSIVDGFHKMPETIKRNGHTYHKDPDVLIENGSRWYVQYRDEECSLPKGQQITNCKVNYIKILAQDWFGMTYAGLDSFICEFSKFVGVWIDENNIDGHLVSFAAYVAKQCDVSPSIMEKVIRYIYFPNK